MTREVESVLVKEGGSRRMTGKGDKTLSGPNKMKGKLADSRGEEDLLRRRRAVLRSDLEDAINNKGGYGRVIKKLNAKVQRIKKTIQVKNRNRASPSYQRRGNHQSQVRKFHSLKMNYWSYPRILSLQ